MFKIPRERRVLLTRGGNPGQPKGRGVIANWGQCQRWTVEVTIGVRIPRERGQSGSERFGDGGVLIHTETAEGLAGSGQGRGSQLDVGSGLEGQDRA